MIELKIALKFLMRTKLLLKFVLVSGIRAGEAVNSFNKIVRLNKRDRLDEYYNRELQNLEHFKYAEIFLRGKKECVLQFHTRKLHRIYAKMSIVIL